MHDPPPPPPPLSEIFHSWICEQKMCVPQKKIPYASGKLDIIFPFKKILMVSVNFVSHKAHMGYTFLLGHSVCRLIQYRPMGMGLTQLQRVKAVPFIPSLSFHYFIPQLQPIVPSMPSSDVWPRVPPHIMVFGIRVLSMRLQRHLLRQDYETNRRTR